MARDPYSVLGVPESATQSEINDAYRKRKEDLQERRFLEGEEGARACEELGELEYAYKEAIERAAVNYSIGDETTLYADVEALIKAGRLDEAQTKLNSLPNYTAEWHYYQSVVYFRKNWHIDAKKQLELALTLDPGNQKYKDSLDELTKVLEGKRSAAGGANQQQQQQQNYYQNQQNPQGRSYQGANDPNRQAGPMGCTVCDCCNALICTDCCCECMGGDFIRCC